MWLNYQFKISFGNRGVKYHYSKEKVNFLAIYINNRINFDDNISQLCKKVEKKLHALSWVFKCIKISEQKLTVNDFKMSQFSYRTLIWMFHDRSKEHRINRTHERNLRFIYPNKHQLTFINFLENHKTVSIHQRYSQTLATEFYKAKNKISPEIVNSLFDFTSETTILETWQFLKGRDTSQSLMEVNLFHPYFRKYGNLFQIESESSKNYQLSKMKLNW